MVKNRGGKTPRTPLEGYKEGRTERSGELVFSSVVFVYDVILIKFFNSSCKI